MVAAAFALLSTRSRPHLAFAIVGEEAKTVRSYYGGRRLESIFEEGGVRRHWQPQLDISPLETSTNYVGASSCVYTGPCTVMPVRLFHSSSRIHP